jgi:hypothetical protein
VDSGASQHMSDQRWAFVNYQRVKPGCWPVNGIGENRKPLQVHGYGTIPISSLVEGCWHDGVLSKKFFTFLTGCEPLQRPFSSLQWLWSQLRWRKG